MPDPWIERIKTETYFHDASGNEWHVVDRWPRQFWDGLIERAPGNQQAVERVFRRYEPAAGSFTPALLEERVYQFSEDDNRWLVAEIWQMQLEMASAVRTPLASTGPSVARSRPP